MVNNTFVAKGFLFATRDSTLVEVKILRACRKVRAAESL
jgi:hypothetical protein